MEDGWKILEKYLNKKIDFELKLVELFILSISAGIVILSLSEYKLIIISVLLQIICLIWTILSIIHDLKKKKEEKTVKEIVSFCFVVSIPFKLNELLILITYVISIIIMGMVILIPYFR